MVGHATLRTFEPALVGRESGGRANLFVLLTAGLRAVRDPFPAFVFEVISHLVQLHFLERVGDPAGDQVELP